MLSLLYADTNKGATILSILYGSIVVVVFFAQPGIFSRRSLD